MHVGVFSVRERGLHVSSVRPSHGSVRSRAGGEDTFAFRPCRSAGGGMLLCQVPAGSASDEPRGARAAQQDSEGGWPLWRFTPSGSTSSAGVCSPDCLFSFSHFALLIFLEEVPSLSVQDALSLLLD